VQVAVVTGASSGIGAAIARELARNGWLCVLLARRAERLREIAEAIGGEYEVCDVADRDVVDATAARVRERHHAVSLLVNNAGIPGRAGFLDADPERIEEVIRTNYLGGVWCVRAFLSALEAGAPSHLVNIASVAGTIAFPPAGPYSASKHAQLAFSRALSPALRRRGIAVHTVKPGFIETEGFPQRSTLRSALMRRTILEPEDVARHVVRVVRGGPSETTIPRFLFGVGVVQAAAPRLLAAAFARGIGARTHRKPVL
jgi:NAD(P)-dependent dehydrogenase (short-subunit alcohol dehydrogenase family)